MCSDMNLKPPVGVLGLFWKPVKPLFITVSYPRTLTELDCTCPVFLITQWHSFMRRSSVKQPHCSTVVLLSSSKDAAQVGVSRSRTGLLLRAGKLISRVHVDSKWLLSSFPTARLLLKKIWSARRLWLCGKRFSETVYCVKRSLERRFFVKIKNKEGEPLFCIFLSDTVCILVFSQ